MSHCHVCGWGLAEPPWGDTGTDPSWCICGCCGCEFGYEDCQASGVLAYRQRWLAAGATWFNPKDRPAGWNLEEQLRHIPTELPAGIHRDG
jgi:hypothetical protein